MQSGKIFEAPHLRSSLENPTNSRAIKILKKRKLKRYLLKNTAFLRYTTTGHRRTATGGFNQYWGSQKRWPGPTPPPPGRKQLFVQALNNVSKAPRVVENLSLGCYDTLLNVSRNVCFLYARLVQKGEVPANCIAHRFRSPPSCRSKNGLAEKCYLYLHHSACPVA